MLTVFGYLNRVGGLSPSHTFSTFDLSVIRFSVCPKPFAKGMGTVLVELGL